MEFLSQLMSNLSIQTALWVAPIFMFIYVFKLLFPRLQGRTGKAAVAQVLERCTPHVLHDIIIPDDTGDTTRLDHVVLTSKGLLVVATRNYRGLIFGSPRDHHWTQRLGRSGRRFLNPLLQNQLQVKALQALNLGVPVCGRVVFADQVRFPNGRPSGVSQLSGLRDDLAGQLHGKPSATCRGAWFQIQRLCGKHESIPKAPPAPVAQVYEAAPRPLFAYALLGSSFAWAFILWLNLSVELPVSVTTAATSTIVPLQPMQPRADQTQTETRLVKTASTPSPRRVVSYQYE